MPNEHNEMKGRVAEFSKADWKGAYARVFQVIALRFKLLAGVLVANLRVNHALSGEWRRRYDQAHRDLQSNDPAFHPSRQWAILGTFYRLILRGRGLAGFKSTFGRFLSTYEQNNPWIFGAVHHLYRASLEKRDVWNLLDTLEEPALGMGTCITYKGKRISLDLLQSIDELYRMKEALGFEKDDRIIFCELGAGYGRLADVILKAMPNSKYLIFDLPESLLLSQYYLTQLHPERKAALYPESELAISSPQNFDKYGLIFGLPHQLRILPKGKVDVFINILSFMEMGRAQIEEYFKIIEDLQVGALYIKQHKREVNLFDQSLNTGSNYPIRPTWTELSYRTSALFEHVFEAVYRVKTTSKPAQISVVA